MVATPEDAALPRVASGLVTDGIELIEIGGGTPLVAAPGVAEALGQRARVSVVAWPFESIDGAAAYEASLG